MSATTRKVFAVPGSDSIVDEIRPETGLSWIEGETLEQIRLRYPGAVVMTLDDFCREKATRQNTPIEWTETTEERYWEMLECLPPAAMKGGGFLVGEPMDHCAATGQPRFDAFIQRGKQFFAASRAITRVEFMALFKPTQTEGAQ